ISEIAGHFDCLEIDPDAPRPAAADWRWQIGWIANDRDRAVRLDDFADPVRWQYPPIRRLCMVDMRFGYVLRGRCADAKQTRCRANLRELRIEQGRCQDHRNGGAGQYRTHPDHHAVISVFWESHGFAPYIRCFFERTIGRMGGRSLSW